MIGINDYDDDVVITDYIVLAKRFNLPQLVCDDMTVSGSEEITSITRAFAAVYDTKH